MVLGERQPFPLLLTDPCSKGYRVQTYLIIVVLLSLLFYFYFNQRLSEPVGLGPQLLKRFSVSMRAGGWLPRGSPLSVQDGGRHQRAWFGSWVDRMEASRGAFLKAAGAWPVYLSLQCKYLRVTKVTVAIGICWYYFRFPLVYIGHRSLVFGD